MQPNPLVLKLGTRRSLLAWAQSSWVAREVERLNPGVQVQLVGIETRGDRIQDIPLQKVEGKDFFVAELDLALQSGAVDLTVHSMKDLSLSRPQDLMCVAIPKRENPRDVILFGPKALERLKAGKPLKIGTSSPRRLENIPAFLERALPKFSPSPSLHLQFVEIRGNVNTRLGRVHEPEDSAKYLDAVVLAFAGLIRLWADQGGQAELKKLLQKVRWMVLPLKECPAAPAQGALAVECRSADEKVKRILSPLHDSRTAAQVAIERQLLAEWGGGCHQRIGATVVSSKELENLVFVRGVKPDGSFVEELKWNEPKPLTKVDRSMPLQFWDGSQHKSPTSGLSSKFESSSSFVYSDAPMGASGGSPAAFSETGSPLPFIFVAHSRAAASGDWVEKLKKSRVWTSGVASWFRLAEQGIWVEGCAEGLGFENLSATALGEAVLEFPPAQDWVALTHAEGLEEWKPLGIQAIPTYKINFDYGKELKIALSQATHVFWSSGSQYVELKEEVTRGAPREIHHACGPGKTAERLRQNGIHPRVFPSVEEWRKWLKTLS